MKHQWKDYTFVLTQLQEFPSFFRELNPNLFLLKISCQELAGLGSEAIASFQQIYSQENIKISKRIALAHVNLLCRQKKHLLTSRKIPQTFEKYFYSQELSYQEKLALLIVYFEKARRSKFDFDCHHLNYFLDTVQTENSSTGAFYNILCNFIVEMINFSNVESIAVIFKRLLEPVKEVSNRKYRMLKTLIVVEVIKKKNKNSEPVLNIFVNSF